MLHFFYIKFFWQVQTFVQISSPTWKQTVLKSTIWNLPEVAQLGSQPGCEPRTGWLAPSLEPCPWNTPPVLLPTHTRVVKYSVSKVEQSKLSAVREQWWLCPLLKALSWITETKDRASSLLHRMGKEARPRSWTTSPCPVRSPVLHPAPGRRLRNEGEGLDKWAH